MGIAIIPGLLPVVESFSKAGAAVALRAEVERVRVEVLRRQEERVAAVQDFLVASAELSRLQSAVADSMKRFEYSLRRKVEGNNNQVLLSNCLAKA